MCLLTTAPLLLSLVAPSMRVGATLPKLQAAVIVPGFLSDQSDFETLADALTQRGIPTCVVPMKLWHWVPIIGGRSIRPVLDRIDHAVRHVAAQEEGSTAASHVPPIEYGLGDVWAEFWSNPGGVAAVGGSTEPDEYPTMDPRGRFPPASEPNGRVALIGHRWAWSCYVTHASVWELAPPHPDAPDPAPACSQRGRLHGEGVP